MKAFVYFIQAGDRIKIGISDNPFRRVRELRTAVPEARVIGWTDGGRTMERVLHRTFAALRIGKSEWFRAEESLVSSLESLDQQWRDRQKQCQREREARDEEIQRLEREASAKRLHADALRAERDARVRSGELVAEVAVG